MLVEVLLKRSREILNFVKLFLSESVEFRKISCRFRRKFGSKNFLQNSVATKFRGHHSTRPERRDRWYYTYIFIRKIPTRGSSSRGRLRKHKHFDLHNFRANWHFRRTHTYQQKSSLRPNWAWIHRHYKEAEKISSQRSGSTAGLTTILL